jgi:tetratricopeptide (TPR) repeat protein
LVFLDLETTGLAGGTGTYAFLAGIARVEGDRFRIEQFFLASPAFEGAFLSAVEAALSDIPGLATYNGRVYDAPLLAVRYILARRPFPLEGKPHLDLLQLARRRWRGLLDSCSLGTVEAHALGVRRTDDVPGWRIPMLYSDFLRSRDARPLTGVFRHNRLDLLSLAALVPRMTAWLKGQEGSPLRAGNLWADRGEEERAGDLWRRAAGNPDTEGSPPDRSEAWRRLARAARRRGDPEEAERALRRALEALPGNSDPISLLVDIAKIREHGLRDSAGALEHAMRALAERDGPDAARRQVERTEEAILSGEDPGRTDPLLHRIARLLRKTGPTRR